MKNLISKTLGIAGITALSFLPLKNCGQTQDTILYNLEEIKNEIKQEIEKEMCLFCDSAFMQNNTLLEEIRNKSKNGQSISKKDSTDLIYTMEILLYQCAGLCPSKYYGLYEEYIRRNKLK